MGRRRIRHHLQIDDTNDKVQGEAQSWAREEQGRLFWCCAVYIEYLANVFEAVGDMSGCICDGHEKHLQITDTVQFGAFLNFTVL